MTCPHPHGQITEPSAYKAGEMKPGDVVMHADHGRVKLLRLRKRVRPGFWTVELLEGVRAGQWYDASPHRLSVLP